MCGLLKALKLKMLEHDPVPSLKAMFQFVQRYRAIQQMIHVLGDTTYGNQGYAIKVVWHFEEVVLLRGDCFGVLRVCVCVWGGGGGGGGGKSSRP